MNYCGVDLLAVLSVCVYFGMFTTVRRASSRSSSVLMYHLSGSGRRQWVASHQCWDGVWCLTALTHSLTPHSSLSHTLAAAAAAAVVCRSLWSIDHTRVSAVATVIRTGTARRTTHIGLLFTIAVKCFMFPIIFLTKTRFNVYLFCYWFFYISDNLVVAAATWSSHLQRQSATPWEAGWGKHSSANYKRLCSLGLNPRPKLAGSAFSTGIAIAYIQNFWH